MEKSTLIQNTRRVRSSFSPGSVSQLQFKSLKNMLQMQIIQTKLSVVQFHQFLIGIMDAHKSRMIIMRSQNNSQYLPILKLKKICIQKFKITNINEFWLWMMRNFASQLPKRCSISVVSICGKLTSAWTVKRLLTP